MAFRPDHPLGPTIDGLVAERASTHAHRPFLRFAAGDLTFAEVHDQTERLAGGLHALGVRAGDVVATLLPNSPEMALTWLALCRLGAVACLVNPALKGPGLRHALGISSASTVVNDAATASTLAEVAPDLDSLRRCVRVGEHDPVAALVSSSWVELAATATRPPPPRHDPADPAMILFTSGTTGPSKGCVLSHRYTVRQAELLAQHLGLVADDVLYSPFPLFHIDATVLTIGPALVLGTTAAVGERFSVSGFWDEIRRTRATVFDFMGATLTLLHKQPPAPHDADNAVRLAWGVPVPDFTEEFEQRFALRLVELYGSTDAGVPVHQPLDEPRRPGSCGRPIDAYDVEVVDEHGLEVEGGAVGEIVVRPKEPSLMADGYVGMPDATLASRRDLWFHTGDLARRDAEGYLFFVGRRAESIRRRGENISAFEVEEIVKLHPAVLDAAVYGVPSELTEDDVMAAVVLRPGASLDPAELVVFCADRMARHMVPRFVDVVEELPRTPTEKVRKEELRARGVTPTTWDAEQSSAGR